MSPDRLIPLFVPLGLAMFAGCASKVAQPSGFLSNPGQLQREKSITGPDYEYRSEADLPVAAGTRVHIAPVTVKLRRPGEVDAATRRRIADAFTAALRAEAAKRHRVVVGRRAAELEVRTVVTELEPSVPAINLTTSIYPSTRISSELRQAVSGEQMFTGEASTEIEVRRVADGRRIYAMMDHATGRKAIATSGSQWAPVEKLCERWAGDLAATMRGERRESGGDDERRERGRGRRR